MANAGRTSVEVAAAAVGALEQDGWLAPDSIGGYLICVPVPLAIPEKPKWPTPTKAVTETKHSAAKEIVTRILRQPVREAAPLPPTPRRVLSYVTYVIGIDGLPFVKIGHTTKPPEERLKSLQTGAPMALQLLCFVRGDYESDLHSYFDAYRVRGEWFDLSSLGDPVEVVKAAVGEIELSRT